MSAITQIRVHPIRGLSAEGLKGQTFAEDLSGLDLFTGPNGAGKTTRGILSLVAAQVGLASVPSDRQRPFIGAKPTNTAVTVTTDSGAQVTRDLSASDRAAKATDAEARRVIGRPTSSWDLSDFAQSTPGQRAQVLRDIASAGGALEAWDVARATARVEELLARRTEPESDTAVHLGAYRACVSALTTAEDGAGWLAAAEEWATAEQTTAGRDQRDAEGAAKSLADAQPMSVGGDGAADAARLREISQQRAELTSPVARQRAQAARVRHEAEGGRLAGQLDSLLGEGRRLATAEPPPVEDAALLARLEDEVRAAQADVSAPIPAWAGADPADLARRVAATQEAIERATSEATSAREQYAVATEQVHAASAQVAECEETAREVERSLAEAHAAVAALASLSGASEVCVHCGESDPLGLATRLEAARYLHEEAAISAEPAQEAVRAARVALDEALAAQRVAELGAARAADAVASRRADLAREQAALEAATRQQSGHADQLRIAREQALVRAQRALTDEQQRRERARREHATREERRQESLTAARQRYRDALAARDEWTATAPPEVPAEPDPEVLAQLDREAAAVQARVDARAAVARWRADCEATSARATESWRYWVGARALVDVVRLVAAEQRSAAYGPIDAAARALVAGSGLVEPYFGGPDDYGAVVPGVGRVRYQALSESERRITAAALVCALAEVSRQPVRVVLLDGLEVVQADHRAPLLAALARARLAGRVDNVLVTLATAPGEDTSYLESAGYQVHRLERAERSVAVESPAAVVPTTTTQPAASADCPF